VAKRKTPKATTRSTQPTLTLPFKQSIIPLQPCRILALQLSLVQKNRLHPTLTRVQRWMWRRSAGIGPSIGNSMNQICSSRPLTASRFSLQGQQQQRLVARMMRRLNRSAPMMVMVMATVTPTAMSRLRLNQIRLLMIMRTSAILPMIPLASRGRRRRR
jgi:hypothetical protein